MPKFLEKKLKAEYGASSTVPYKVMNSIGAMHGNKETAKGRAMGMKHAAKMSTPKTGSLMHAAKHGFMDHATVHPGKNLGEKWLHPKKR